jgi:putative PIN family toxin of toxin-antitoxin system
MPLRLVLDTNVWLDWLVFQDPGVAALKTAEASGHAEIFIDRACSKELERALTYTLQKRVLDADAQSACLAECRRLASMNEGGRMKEEKSSLPICRDPDDQKFLELARDCGADFLVTKDHALLELARRKLRPAPFHIVTPQQFTDAVKADT